MAICLDDVTARYAQCEWRSNFEHMSRASSVLTHEGRLLGLRHDTCPRPQAPVRPAEKCVACADGMSHEPRRTIRSGRGWSFDRLDRGAGSPAPAGQALVTGHPPALGASWAGLKCNPAGRERKFPAALVDEESPRGTSRKARI